MVHVVEPLGLQYIYKYSIPVQEPTCTMKTLWRLVDGVSRTSGTRSKTASNPDTGEVLQRRTASRTIDNMRNFNRIMDVVDADDQETIGYTYFMPQKV